MDVKFVEATNGPRNHGKFMVARFDDDEWKYLSEVDGRPLLAGRGWSREHTLVIDLQTGEGAFFPEWVHHADLAKHQVWVCPMFEPALKAICDGQHDPMQTDALLDFPDAPFEWAGYRRQGPDSDIRVAAAELSDVWDRYIGIDDREGDDDVDAVVDAIGKLRIALYGDELPTTRSYDRDGNEHNDVLRTETGKVVTEADIDDWVADANEGYETHTFDPEQGAQTFKPSEGPLCVECGRPEGKHLKRRA